MDSGELEQKMRSLIREGTVSVVYSERMTARVTFGDKDDNVSAELPVLTQGSSKDKVYWLPSVDDVVVCLFASNDEESGTGWILGTRFNDVDKTPENTNKDTRKTQYEDGTFIQYNKSTHTLEINCVGDIIIKGKTIFLN